MSEIFLSWLSDCVLGPQSFCSVPVICNVINMILGFCYFLSSNYRYCCFVEYSTTTSDYCHCLHCVHSRAYAIRHPSACLSVCSILWHAVRECRQCHICQLTWSWTQTCLIQSLLVESYKSGVTPVYLSSLTDWHCWCCLFVFSCNWFILLCLYSQLIKIFILIPFFDLHLQWCLAYDSFFQGCVAVNFEACVRAWS